MRPAIAFLFAAVVTVTACGGSKAAQAPATVSSTATTAAPMAFASSAFADGEPIPARFTCSGADTSPPLRWATVPAGAEELDLVVLDHDANDFVHWLVVGIPPKDGALAAGSEPAGTALRNSFGSAGWKGPCPPPGKAHHYEFTLYAVDRTTDHRAGASADDVLRAIDGPVLASASFTGTFER